MATAKRSRGGSPLTSHVSPSQSSSLMATDFPGLLREPTKRAFSSDSLRATIRELEQVASASLAAVINASDGPPVAQRQATDVPWHQIRGDARGTVMREHREVTVPAPGLDPVVVKKLHNRAASTALAPRRAVGHYSRLQCLSQTLADAALGRLRAAGAVVPAGIYFIAAQFSYSPPGAVRGLHIDPPAIAAALATLSLRGRARITLEERPRGGTYTFESDPQWVYMLTGEELGALNADRPVRHAVEVGNGPRLSLTLRFADPTILGPGSSRNAAHAST